MILRAITTMTVAASLMLAGGTAAGVALDGSAGAVDGWQQPVHGAAVTQGFGCTDVILEPVNTSCPGGHWHSGVDLAAASGTPVYSSVPGVVRVIDDGRGYGLHVIIDHDSHLSVLYGHLSAVDVSSGEIVGTGDRIGAVGSSGNSTGPHLHFEVRRDGIAEDPRLDVALPQGR